jgi:1-acyl-sn-glycerol-3-phosphate acyltransferase
MQRLVSAWTWTCWVLVVLVGFPCVAVVFAVTAPFDPGRYHAGRVFRWFGALGARLNPWWHFETRGAYPRDPRHPYVAVSNHESYADIFLISHLPWEMKWLAKQTIFNIPVMGWIMRMAGDVPLVRGNRQSAVGALAMCRDRLAKRVSVMVFPEGTRSPPTTCCRSRTAPSRSPSRRRCPSCRSPSPAPATAWPSTRSGEPRARRVRGARAHPHRREPRPRRRAGAARPRAATIDAADAAPCATSSPASAGAPAAAAVRHAGGGAARGAA